jgi:hypothetical protein
MRLGTPSTEQWSPCQYPTSQQTPRLPPSLLLPVTNTTPDLTADTHNSQGVKNLIKPFFFFVADGGSRVCATTFDTMTLSIMVFRIIMGKCDTRHNGTQHNGIQAVAECRYAKCHYDECRGAIEIAWVPGKLLRFYKKITRIHLLG